MSEFSIHDNGHKRQRQQDASVAGAGEMAWDLHFPGGGGEQSAGPQQRATCSDAEPEKLAALQEILGTDEEENNALPKMDIKRLARGCWTRRYLVAAIAAAVLFVFGTLAFSLLHHEWTAVTTLIKRETKNVFVVGDGKPFNPQIYNIQTLLNTLKLPSSLDETMRRTGINVERTTLAAAIDVSLGKDSDILNLKANWEDPQTASVLANHLADVFIERSRQIRRSDARQAYEYYSERLAETRTQRRLIDDDMMVFQRANKLSNFDAETEARLGQLARLEGEYQMHKSEAQALRDAIARLEEEIASQPEMAIKSTIYRSPLKQRLSDYEWQLEEAYSRYTADNPKVMKLQKHVNVLTRMISGSNDESVPENTYAPNMYRMDLHLHLQEVRDNLNVAEGRTGALLQSITDIQEKLDFLSSKEQDYIRLKVRQEASQALEYSLAHRADEARLQMLRAEAAFDVVERASPPEEPQASGRKLVVAGGGFVGISLGLLVALLMELLDPRVRTRRDGSDLSAAEVCSEWERMPGADARRITPQKPTSPTAMMFRHFVNNLEAHCSEEQLQSIAVISAECGAGRSLVAANLVRTLSLKDRRSLLIDADVRSNAGPRPGEVCASNTNRPGLLQVLKGKIALKKALAATDNSKLYCLGPGQADSDQSALLALGGRHMETLIQTLRGFSGRVIYDLPALQGQETAIEAAAAIGNAILVLRSGWSKNDDIKQLITVLQARRINILGTLVVDVPDNYLEQATHNRQQHSRQTMNKKDRHDEWPDILQDA